MTCTTLMNSLSVKNYFCASPKSLYKLINHILFKRRHSISTLYGSKSLPQFLNLKCMYSHICSKNNFTKWRPETKIINDSRLFQSSRQLIKNFYRIFCESNDDKKNDKKDNNDNPFLSLIVKAVLWILVAYVFIITLSVLYPARGQPEIFHLVSWNEFLYHMLDKGEVQEIIVRPDLNIVTIILYEGAVIKGKKVEHRSYHMSILDINDFEQKLRHAEESLGIRPEDKIPVIYERGASGIGKLLVSLMLLGFLLYLLTNSKNIRQAINMDAFTSLTKARFTIVDPLTSLGKGVKFSDVAGLKEAKQEVMEFVDYLKNPQFYKELGAKIPHGALLLGPPGCGKTLLAKAVATESNVPFLAINGTEFIEMIGGLGAARVRNLFKEARKRAPCIIYIDEIDAIGKQREQSPTSIDVSSGESEQTLDQLLVEMDGISTKENVIVLSSTNRAEVLDKALLRRGRFDRHILIDLPTLQERQEIFEYHLKTIVLDKNPSYYSHYLSSLTPGFSGADIANVCNEAALYAARNVKKAICLTDLEYAVDKIIGGIEKSSHVMSTEEKQMVAYHESGHALVGWLLEHTEALIKVTIIPRTNQALGFSQYTLSDQKLYSDIELFEKMCMALGGRAAELLIFNKVSTAAQNDLQKVTKMAYDQIKNYGMSKVIGNLSFSDGDEQNLKICPYSKKLANTIDAEVRNLVHEAFKKTEILLRENKNKLEKIAKELLLKETLKYEDIEALIGPTSFSKKTYIDPAQFEASLDTQEKVDSEKEKILNEF